MDLKYISENKILMIYGLLGSILCFIVSIITTFVECEETTSNKKDIYDDICIIKSGNKKYFQNFYIYFQNFNSLEILKIIFLIIFFFFNKYFSIIIIKFLTPAHFILSIPAYFIIQKIVLIINTLIRDKTFFNEKNKYNFRTEKLIFDSLGDIFSLLGLFIYLEIIELNFCKLNYNLRRNIINRGNIELLNFNDDDSQCLFDEKEIEVKVEKNDMINNSQM